MATVVDSSIWVDCLRKGSSAALLRQTKAIIMAHDRYLCEPIVFELLRAIPRRDRVRTEALIATVPTLTTPSELWRAAQLLGQKCIDNGFLPPSIDLLIAQVCLFHDVPIVTFDIHFQQIGEVSSLRVNFLERAK
jgi:predicted nucleic acid-binding protein